MLKVLKFGGSSLADARQFAKVKSIVEADPARRVVIVSAPGKRFSGDHKITDLLYLCAAQQMPLAAFINVQNRIAVFILQRLIEPEGTFIQRHIAQIRIHASQSKNVIGQRIRQLERAGCRIQLRACLVDVDGVGDSRLLVAALDAVALLDVTASTVSSS